MQADIAVRDMMVDLQTTYKERREMLVELLGVDLDWRMHQLSDGQRRRVQLMLQLLRPSKLLLLDEITTGAERAVLPRLPGPNRPHPFRPTRNRHSSSLVRRAPDRPRSRC